MTSCLPDPTITASQSTLERVDEESNLNDAQWKVPIEIAEHILDEMASYDDVGFLKYLDTKSLENCRLTCRTLSRPAGRHLFSTLRLQLTEKQLQTLEVDKIRLGSVGKFVRALAIIHRFQGTVPESGSRRGPLSMDADLGLILDAFLPLLPQVTSLLISVDRDHGGSHWLSTHLPVSLLSLNTGSIAFLTIKTPQETCLETFAGLMNFFPKARKLHVSSSEYGPRAPGPQLANINAMRIGAVGAWPGNLEELRIINRVGLTHHRSIYQWLSMHRKAAWSLRRVTLWDNYADASTEWGFLPSATRLKEIDILQWRRYAFVDDSNDINFDNSAENSYLDLSALTELETIIFTSEGPAHAGMLESMFVVLSTVWSTSLRKLAMCLRAKHFSTDESGAPVSIDTLDFEKWRGWNWEHFSGLLAEERFQSLQLISLTFVGYHFAIDRDPACVSQEVEGLFLSKLESLERHHTQFQVQARIQNFYGE